MRRRISGWALLTALLVLPLLGCAQSASNEPPRPTSSPSGGPIERAIFAGGCFWCVEADFDRVPGVLSTISGYIGGTVANPSYEQVARKQTGHAEAVEVIYDPQQVSYAQLVEFFWRTVDPTDDNGQFCDKGSPYRTAIFAVGPEQLRVARESLLALEKTKPFKDPIFTQIESAGPFYAAEGYHQDYYRNNPVRYEYYRFACGRDARLQQIWGNQAMRLPSGQGARSSR